MNTGDPTIGDRLKGRTAVKEEIESAILALAKVAATIGMQESSDALCTTAANLRDDKFKILVMGRFNNGKSTLLNALTGGVTHSTALDGRAGPLPVGRLPATAVLTRIEYDTTPAVTAWHMDGSSRPWSLSQFLENSTLDNTVTSRENAARFENIREFELRYPARLCQNGVVLYDSPGTEENPRRTAITEEAATRCDAAIVVFGTHSPLGEQEVVAAVRLIEGGTKVFAALNVFDPEHLDDPMRAMVWNKFLNEYQEVAQPWAGEDLTTHDIFPVDARRAAQARHGGDPAGVERSGLSAFEDRLAQFLLDERFEVHVQRFSAQAVEECAAVEQQIRAVEVAARADQTKFQRDFEQVLPKLAELHKRAKRIDDAVEHATEQGVSQLEKIVQSSERGILADLPGHLDTVRIQSGNLLTATLRLKKTSAAAEQAINDFVKARREKASKRCEERLHEIMTRMFDTIAGEVAEIDRELENIKFALVGRNVDAAAHQPVIGNVERAAAAVLGLVFGNAAGAVTGGAGGWRGAVGGAAGAIGTVVALSAAGAGLAVIAPAALVAAAVLGQAAGAAGLERRVKENALKKAIDDLRDQEPVAVSEVEKVVRAQFAKLDPMRQSISSALAAEEQKIHATHQANRGSQAERARTLEQMEDARTELKRWLTTLEGMLTKVRQGVR
ncbi:dynamin family protein [Lentzea cavernae]|uniref:Dynamin N-terminal domain-containing protein n=1 Tax=Lentzea cavernae TaxID=2020703 RepID=A0ABQ3MPX6_9PSEU|nr:dynamin family protein [Lentzea cavernae]GHH42681.1 hypothetical protein GCM10017774_39440 [Lentzea cavernae]